MKSSKLIPIAVSALAMGNLASAQSDGRAFDALIVMAPGLTVERNGAIYGGDWSSGWLRDGDLIRTEDGPILEPYLILTTDGSVVALSSGTTVEVEGQNRGFNVFQTTKGNAWVAGNLQTGFVLPNWFRSRTSLNLGNVRVVPDTYYYPFWSASSSNGWYGGTPVFGNVVTAPYGGSFVIPGIR